MMMMLTIMMILVTDIWISGCTPSVAAKHRICVGDIRLVSGIDNSSGFVEIYLQNTWGVICNHYWKVDAARVTCRQLGYDDGVPKPGAKYEFHVPHEVMESRQQIPSHLSSVVCTGNESTLLHCDYSTTGTCASDDHVAVNCLGARDHDVIDVCSYNFRFEGNFAVSQNVHGLVNIIAVMGYMIMMLILL